MYKAVELWAPPGLRRQIAQVLVIFACDTFNDSADAIDSLTWRIEVAPSDRSRKKPRP
jgi:hypothetical protein